ncbi:uncharacterized protein Dwil_GK14953 [Drosophila willistoni]|uniref:Uncharacterized protein n=1 Tax=Drosophila willistoni TaxID=7260 RepID=B4MW28_DROWI|nr:uncharacterized protein LOC6642857 [Drosophila willistoni]EDW75898.2 uncharacterized protein Dwil_GK14953 [Drosophila willistoni]
MMKHNLLWDTLQAVEQVEVAFEQTLKTIDDINHRYKLVSAFKRLANKRQQSYEAEIQAAITGPLVKLPPLYAYTKISTAPQGSRKKKYRKRKSNVRPKKLDKSFTHKIATPHSSSGSATPASTLRQLDMEMPENVAWTNGMYEFEQQSERIGRTKGNQSYRNRIRRLHEAAQKKLEQEQYENNNGHGRQIMQSEQGQIEDFSDQNEELLPCNVHCSSSWPCQCEYF